jgi:hypothetical protein
MASRREAANACIRVLTSDLPTPSLAVRSELLKLHLRILSVARADSGIDGRFFHDRRPFFRLGGRPPNLAHRDNFFFGCFAALASPPSRAHSLRCFAVVFFVRALPPRFPKATALGFFIMPPYFILHGAKQECQRGKSAPYFLIGRRY